MPNLRNSPVSDISREFQTGLPPDIRVRPYIEFVYNDLSSTSEVLSGEAEATYLYAPEGFIYECIALLLYVYSPLDSTSGTHNFIVSTWGPIDILEMKSNYEDDLLYSNCEVLIASYSERPRDKTTQGLVPNYLFADENNAIRLLYVNETDVTQTNERMQRILLKKVKV